MRVDADHHYRHDLPLSLALRQMGAVAGMPYSGPVASHLF
jgi:hypothetical protein